MPSLDVENLLAEGAAAAFVERADYGGTASLVVLSESGATLATLPMSRPAFRREGSQAIAEKIEEGRIERNGKAARFRVLNGAGEVLIDGVVLKLGQLPPDGEASIAFSSLDFRAGGTCAVSGFAVNVEMV